MRRRPSGSAEDEEDATEPTPVPQLGLSPRPNGTGELRTTGDVPEIRSTPPRRQNRKPSKEVDGSPTQWLRTEVPHMRTTPESPITTPEAPAAMLERHRRTRQQQRNPWACSLLTLATSVFAIGLLVTILHSFLNRQQDPKGCAMSYMRPAFTRYSDFDTEHTRFASKYSLYLYREGGVDEDTRVKGIPVLFVPGNAGSYKQVRPIAAEAAHYFHDTLRLDLGAATDGKVPLDVFSVDFNEDITAFHGETLLEQAEYLNEAVAFILALYHQPARSLREPGLPLPKAVMILGHSMGGVVARTMLTLPNYQEHTVNTIITLSAPHARAPISVDAEMVSVYGDVNRFWRQSYSQVPTHQNPLADITLISIAGGGLDTMIPSEYTSVTSLVPETHGFTVFTSSIPNVWTGMDHLAIMWCDQFRKALVRAIFDVADARRAAQTKVQNERIRVIRRRLLTGMEPVIEKAILAQELDTRLTIAEDADGILHPGQRLALRSHGAAKDMKAHLLPVPVQPFAAGSKFTLLTNQVLDTGDDAGSLVVLLCSELPLQSGMTFPHSLDLSGDEPVGSQLACKNAAVDQILLPASTNESLNAFDDAKPFSYLQFDLPDIAEHDFVAVIEKASEESHGWLIAEFITGAMSSVTVSKGHHELLAQGLTVQLPASRAMMSELKIPEIHSTLFAYRFAIERQPCDRFEESFTPLLRQYIAEPYESKFFVNAKGGNINVHGLSPYMPPPLRGGGATDGLSLTIWSDPVCNSTVNISLHVDVLGSAGKLVMRYRTVFAAFPLLVMLIVMRKQMKVYDTTGVFMSFSSSMDVCLRTSLPFVFIALSFLAVSLSKAAQGSWTRSWLSLITGTSGKAVDFNVNDLLLGTQDPFFWFLVPLFGIISIGIIIAGNYVITALLHVLAFVYGRVSNGFGRQDDARRTTTPFSPGARHTVLITTLLGLLITTLIPYQFAYLLLTVLHFSTTVRALRVARDTKSSANYNFYNYAHTLLVLMLWVLPVQGPALIVWCHNLAARWLTSFSAQMNLLSIVPILAAVELAGRGEMVARTTGRARHITNMLTFLAALYAAVYGVTYAYRLHHILNILAAWLVLLHFARKGFAGAIPWSAPIDDRPHTPPVPEKARIVESDVKKRP
ncbi:GPI inositol deacylase [Oleoguttula sp. CCFEE 5521]